MPADAYADNPRAYWTRRGLTYAREEAGLGEVTQRQAGWLLDWLEGPCVIELGCGYGRLLRPLTQLRPGWTFIGVDFSLSQLRSAEEHLRGMHGQVELIHADMAGTGLTDRRGHTVLTAGALMHVPPRRFEAVLSEARRLAPRLIHVEETRGDARFVWAHDYSASHAAAGWRLLHSVPFPHPAESYQRLRCEVYAAAPEEPVA